MRSLFRVLALTISLLLASSHVAHAASLSAQDADNLRAGKTVEIGERYGTVRAQVKDQQITITPGGSGPKIIDKGKFRDLLNLYSYTGADNVNSRRYNIRFDGRVALPADSSYLFSGWRGNQITGHQNLDTSRVTTMRGMFQGTDAVLYLTSLGWNLNNLKDFSLFCADSTLVSTAITFRMPGDIPMTDWNKNCAVPDRRTLQYTVSPPEEKAKPITATINMETLRSELIGRGDIDRAAFLTYRDALISHKAQTVVFGGRLILPEDSSELFRNIPAHIEGLQFVDPSQVKNMARMFQGYRGEITDTTTWNVRNVENFESLLADTELSTKALNYWLIQDSANTKNILGTNPPAPLDADAFNPYFVPPQDKETQEQIRKHFKKTFQYNSLIQGLNMKLADTEAPFNDLIRAHTAEVLQQWPLRDIIIEISKGLPEMELPQGKLFHCGGDMESQVECLLAILYFTYYPSKQAYDPGYRSIFAQPTKEADVEEEAAPPTALQPESQEEEANPQQNSPQQQAPNTSTHTPQLPRASRVTDSVDSEPQDSGEPQGNIWAWVAVGAIAVILGVASSLTPLALELAANAAPVSAPSINVTFG
ncbi:MAG: BspA family leucine-rich repeat surface protein [Corynebacterium sp.]|nr:BspA family leucine-rich repeat surface protein [Corynebacterium sp.]